jgi:hypothetical protein
MRTLLFTLLLLVFYPPLSAQISIGAHLGSGMADNSIIFKAQERQRWDADGVLAANLGLGVALNISPRWVLETGINADLRGNSRLATTNHYLYASVPLMLRYQWQPRWLFKPYVGAGAYAAHLLEHRTVTGRRPTVDIFLAEFQDPKTVDWGLLGAVGSTMAFHQCWSLFLECRASWGLAKLYEYPQGKQKLSERRTNVGLILNTGVRRTLR